MAWGDVPAWIAIALSIIAGWRAWLAGQRAKEARAGADSVETSLQRMADSFAAIQQLEERRWKRLGEFSLYAPNTEAAAALAPSFTLEFVKGHAYRLRNVGTAAASKVTVLPDGLPPVVRQLPKDVDLPPFASTSMFVMQGLSGAPMPGEIKVTCSELSDPQIVMIPPRG